MEYRYASPGIRTAGRNNLAVERGGCPLTPTHRSFSTPLIQHAEHGFVRGSSATSVPHSGLPVMNDLVPSMGSKTQVHSCNPPSPSSMPSSSPKMACVGNRSWTSARMAASAPLSAMVTGDASFLSSISSGVRKCFTVMRAAASTRSAARATVLGGVVRGGRGGGDGSARGGSWLGARRDRKSHPDTLDDAVGGAPRRGRGRDGCGYEGHGGSRADLRCIARAAGGRVETARDAGRCDEGGTAAHAHRDTAVTWHSRITSARKRRPVSVLGSPHRRSPHRPWTRTG